METIMNNWDAKAQHECAPAHVFPEHVQCSLKITKLINTIKHPFGNQQVNSFDKGI